MSLGVSMDIATRLAQSWEALSAEARAFDFSDGLDESPPYAEFSYIIPMTLGRDRSMVAVAILIERRDACTVASAMFDVPRDELPDEDLRDACSEVCNIFAECITKHLTQTEGVTVGLPFCLSESNYHHVFDASGHREVYQSQQGGCCLAVMVFTPTDASIDES